MSHYCKVDLKMSGDKEAVIRALCAMKWRGLGNKAMTKEQRSLVEVHKVRQNLYGHHADKREEKAHLIVRRGTVGGASNDIGLEQKADGNWSLHVSEFDKRHGYGDDWQKRFLSEWAVQRVGVEAEAQGYTWETQTSECQKFQYVHVNVVQNRWV